MASEEDYDSDRSDEEGEGEDDKHEEHEGSEASEDSQRKDDADSEIEDEKDRTSLENDGADWEYRGTNASHWEEVPDDSLLGSTESQSENRSSIVWDFRKGRLPENCEVSGSSESACFQLQSDKTQALQLTPGQFLKLAAPGLGTKILTTYTLFVDIRFERLPKDGMSLYHAHPAYKDSEGEALIYSEGGVGLYGFRGIRDSWIQPKKWTRVAIAVRPNELTTYVDGKKCTEVDKKRVSGQPKRFSLDTSNFLPFYSSNSTYIPGQVAVRRIELRKERMTDDHLLAQAQEGRIASTWDDLRKKRIADMRKGLSLRAALGAKAPPCWYVPDWAAAVAGLETGECNTALATILFSQAVNTALESCEGSGAYALLNGFEHSERQALEQVCATLKQSVPIAKFWMQATGEEATDEHAITFVRKLRKIMTTLAEGESIVFPGGAFGAPALFIVQRGEADAPFQFAMSCAATGTGHHPSRTTSSSLGPVIEHKIVFSVEVARERIFDDLFWATLTRLPLLKNVPADRLFEVLLPWLGGGKKWQEIAANAQKNEAVPWQATSRSGAQEVQCVEAAILYMLRSQVGPEKCERAQEAVRSAFIAMAQQDMRCIQALDKSERKMLTMACENFAASVSSPSLALEQAQLKQLRCWLDRVLSDMSAVPKDNGPFPEKPPADLDIRGDNDPSCWQLPFVERLLRQDDINHLAGPPEQRPGYVAADFLKVAKRCEKFEEARDALRFCDRLCTLLMVQEPYITNATFLRVALLEHTLTQVVPVPFAPNGPYASQCIWASYKYLYAQQLDMLILLHRLQDHFAAASCSVRSTRAFDAVMLVVPGCVAAIADCVMRQTPTDIPSEVCTHLTRFGVHPGMFGPTSETIEVHSPTVNVARTAVLDYFTALEHLPPIFAWEKGMLLTDHPQLSAMLGDLCAELAFPGSPFNYCLDGLMTVNYSEWRCYRDIVYWFKFFSNPSAEWAVQQWEQVQVTQKWGIQQTDQGPAFQVLSFVDPGQGPRPIVAKPEYDELTGEMQRNRYPSTATPTFYLERDLLISIWEAKGKGVFPPEFTEDDVLHITRLPEFKLKDGKAMLGQRDSELLLSYMTVPYLRLPLTLLFFATKDRVHSLRSKELQGILDSCLFEPGRHLPVTLTTEPTTIPTSNIELLATPYGQLLNELTWSPKTVTDAIFKLLTLALDMDTGTVHEESILDIVLYCIRVAARIESYLQFVLDHWEGKHESVWWPLRESCPSKETVELVTNGLKDLRRLLLGATTNMLEAWSEEALDEIAELLATNKDDLKVEENTVLICDIYAHMLLLHRNVDVENMNAKIASLMACSYVFITTRHQWNRELLRVPETEVYEVLQMQRRRLVYWLNGASTDDVNEVMAAAVRVATGTGRRLSQEEGHQRLWVARPGPLGRFTTAIELKHGRFGTLVDTQTMQLTLSENKLFNLQSQIAQDRDVLSIFGQVVMQASTIQSAQNREWVRLVGRRIELQWWKTADSRHPPCHEAVNREYNPGELEGCEQWIVPIFEPIRLQHYNQEPGMPPVPPYTFYLHEDPLPADARVVYMFGKRFNPQIGIWQFVECVVLRERGIVHGYKLVSYGRRWYRTLDYVSDVRFALRDMEPQKIGPPTERLPAKDEETAPSMDGTCVTIWRDSDHSKNLSGGQEQLIPSRLFYGVLPCCMLDAYEFWQDESDNLRGYSETHVLFVALEEGLTAATQLPGYCARVSRRAIADVKVEHESLVRIVEALENIGCPDEPENDPDESRDIPRSALFRRYDRIRVALSVAGQLGNSLADPASLIAELEISPPNVSVASVEECLADALARISVPARLEQSNRALEDLESYILPWSKDPSKGGYFDLVELPRVKLAFQARDIPFDTGEGLERRFYSLDYAGMYVTNDRDELCTGFPPIEDVGDARLISPHSMDHYVKASSEAKQDNKITLLWLTASWCGACTKMKPHIARFCQDFPEVSFIKVDIDELPDVREAEEYGELEDGLSGVPFFVITRGIKVETRFAGADPSRLKGKLEELAGARPEPEIASTSPPTVVPANEPLIAGLPHALVMTNSTKEHSFLMPALPPFYVKTGPFGTDVLIVEKAAKWLKQVPQPSYLYPVHVSLAFLQLPTMAMSLYLLLMRFLHRDYLRGFRLAESIATDKEYTGEETQILEQMDQAKGYTEPDASALRLKIVVSTLDSPVKVPWDVLGELYLYTSRLHSVSSGCRLTDEEELVLLEKYGVTSRTHPLLLAHEIPYEVVHVLANRKRFLEAQRAGLLEMVAMLPLRRADLKLEDTLFSHSGSDLLRLAPPTSELLLCRGSNLTNADMLPRGQQGRDAIRTAGVRSLKMIDNLAEDVFALPVALGPMSFNPDLLQEGDCLDYPPPVIQRWAPRRSFTAAEDFAAFITSRKAEWPQYQNFDSFVGEDAHVEKDTSIGRCKEICVEHSYSAFAFVDGVGFFRQGQSRSEVIANRVPTQGVTLFVRPPSEEDLVVVFVGVGGCPISMRAQASIQRLAMEFPAAKWVSFDWDPEFVNPDDPENLDLWQQNLPIKTAPSVVFYRGGSALDCCEQVLDLELMRAKLAALNVPHSSSIPKDAKEYLVDSSQLSSLSEFLDCYRSPNLEDKDEGKKGPAFGSIVFAVPAGDDWVAFGDHFLPTVVEGSQVLVPVEHAGDALDNHCRTLHVKYVRSKLRGNELLDLTCKLLAGVEDTRGGKLKKGFLLIYELLTGSLDAKLIRDSNCDFLSSIGLAMMRDNLCPTILPSTLRAMMRAPAEVLKSLPRYVDTRKKKMTSPEDIFGMPTSENSLSPLLELFKKLLPQIGSYFDSMKLATFAVPECPAWEVKVPSPARVPRLFASDFQCQSRELSKSHLLSAGSEQDILEQPMSKLSLAALLAKAPRDSGIDDTMPFHISQHPQARSVPSQKLLERLKNDVAKFANQMNNGEDLRLVSLLDADIKECIGPTPGDAIDRALKQIRRIIASVQVLHAADKTTVEKQLGKVVEIANDAKGDDVGSFQLQRFGRREMFANAEFCFAVQLSSLLDADMRNVNPFLSDEQLNDVQVSAFIAILHGNRMAQANRCIDTARDVLKFLDSARKLSNGDANINSEVVAAGLLQKSQSLADLLNAHRNYMEFTEDSGGSWRFDPRFLIFEFTSGFLLRQAQFDTITQFFKRVHKEGGSMVKQMIMGSGKTTVVAPLLALMLADSQSLLVSVVPQALVEMSRDVMRSMFSVIMQKRVYSLVFERTTVPDASLEAKLDRARRSAGVVISAPSSVKAMMLQMLETLMFATNVDMEKKKRVDVLPNTKRLAKMITTFRQGIMLIDEVDLVLHPLKSELNFPVGPKPPLDFSPLRWELPMQLIDGVLSADGRKAIGFEESQLARGILDDMKGAVQNGYELQALQKSPHLILLNLEWYHEVLKPIMRRWTSLWLSQQHIEGLSSDEVIEFITIGGVQMVEKDENMKSRCKGIDASHMKMLNLSFDWLEQLLPHCLAKIDRVSFGVMTKEDIVRALAADPKMPPTRKYLAIPFVGKDTPSAASEFAHPDIVIGLTVLAYRYEGLRYDDFDYIVQSLKEKQMLEFGPIELRKATQKHKEWVEVAGGRVREVTLDVKTLGDSKARLAYFKDLESRQNEVVPLQMLNRSNERQMSRLYDMWMMVPQTIYWYLVEYLLPEYMRHQTTKLSASGQDLGGSMLFPRRVGFSGTPSDLIPLEFGNCHYEEGTDGRFIYTMTCPDIVSLEDLPADWNPKSILKAIAELKPPHQQHALIDTGALITGYSNLGVAKALFEYGIGDWCEGVVYLDEADRKMILMRDTGRSMKLAQSGVSLEKRFAFYDQVHTTGMDIKHTLSATAVLTLGKDMVFRDYTQGAYRMRQIAQGQRIHLMVTPEVKELIARELLKARFSITLQKGTGDSAKLGTSLEAVAGGDALRVSGECDRGVGLIQEWNKDHPNQALDPRVVRGQDIIEVNGKRDAKDMFTEIESTSKLSILVCQAPVAQDEDVRGRLLNITTWLNINSMRFERLQYNMLCQQNIQNLFRKRAFDELLSSIPRFQVGPSGEVEAPGLDMERHRCLEQAFKEPIVFDVCDSIPEQLSFVESIQRRKAEQSHLMSSEDEVVAKSIINDIQVQQQKQQDMVGASQQLEMEQQQEMESEKERENVEVKEQEVEIEKFVEMKYSREDEDQAPWELATLASLSDAAQFYPMHEFKLFNRNPIDFPRYLNVSSNYFNKTWDGERRIKNTIIAMEWVPDVSLDRALEPPRIPTLDEEQAASIKRAMQLLDLSGSEGLGSAQFCTMVKDTFGLQLEVAKVQDALKEMSSRSLSFSCSKMADSLCANFEGVKELLQRSNFLQEESGRYWVVLSLAEAETLRRVLHLKARLKEPLLPGLSTSVALRCIPSSDLILDSSRDMPSTHAFQQQLAWQCHRFLDCDMYFSEAEIGALLHALPTASTLQRERFFKDVLGVRRRSQRRFKKAPVAQMFKVSDEFSLLKRNGFQRRMRESIQQKGFLLLDAFQAFDSDSNGEISAPELFGAMTWLEIPNVTATEVLEFMAMADVEDRLLLDYSNFVKLVRGDDLSKDSSSFVLPESTERMGSDFRTQPRGEAELEQARKQMVAQRDELHDEEHQEKLRQLEEQARLQKIHEEQQAATRGNPCAEWIGRSEATRYYHITFDFSRGEEVAKARPRGDATCQDDHVLMENLAHVFIDADLPVRAHVQEDSAIASAGTLPNLGLPPQLAREISNARTPFPSLVRSISASSDESGAPKPQNLEREPSVPWGKRLNQFTLTVQLMLPELPSDLTPLMQTHHVRDAVGTVYINSEGRLGTEDKFASSGPSIKATRWHVVSLVYDAAEADGNRMIAYLDGEMCMAWQTADMAADGAFSLNKRICIFGDRDNQRTTEIQKGLRRVELHTACLPQSEIKVMHDNILADSAYKYMCSNLGADLVDSIAGLIQDGLLGICGIADWNKIMLTMREDLRHNGGLPDSESCVNQILDSMFS